MNRPDLSTIPYLRWAKTEAAVGEYLLTSSAVPPLDWNELGMDPRSLALCEYTMYGDEKLLADIASPWNVTSDHVFLASSTTHAHYCFAVSTLRPGDTVLTENPGYTCVIDALSSHEVQVSYFQRRFEDGFSLPQDEIRKAVRERQPKLLLLTNLHNPSGVALTEEECQFLVALCEEFGISILCDEIYRPFLDPDPGPLSLRHPNIVSVWGLNKPFGLPQIRIGWGVATPKRVERARRILDATVAHNSCLSDQVARFAVAKLEDLRQRGLRIAREGWETMGPSLARLPLEVVEPTAGVVCFPRFTDGGDRLREILLQEGVGVTPGRFFGSQEHVRIGFSPPAEYLNEAVRRMEAALARE